MAVKVIMTWDLKRGHEQEYFEFVVGEYLPKVNQLGLVLTDAWLTAYGERPTMLVGGTIPTLTKARHLFESVEWADLENELLDFVDDYNVKVLDLKGGFQF